MRATDILKACKNWNDFKAILKGKTNNEKGDAFELLTKYYLQINPVYATKLKNVWLLKEVPPNIRTLLNLPSSDEGIDLIAQTHIDTYWAIQSKYRDDKTHSTTRRELSTFTDLAFNICKNIELGLVCTTANRYSYKLKMHGKKISFCSGSDWEELGNDFFMRINELLNGSPALLKPLQPRPHQQSAVSSAYNFFIKEKNSRGKMIMPCGTGKSLTGFWISSKMDAKKVLVAVPSLALTKQTIEVWTRESLALKKSIEWIAICSDETVAETENEDLSFFTQDLGIQVESDVKDIKDWLVRNKDNPLVVFTTYQSCEKIAAACKEINFSFDLSIFDEAHRTVGDVSSLFSHLLFDNNISSKNRLFMTATERRYKGTSDEIASMDDLSIYGGTFMEMSFKDALDAAPPLLSDYKIVTILVDHKEVKDLIDRDIIIKSTTGRWNKQIEARQMASLIALRKAMNLYPIKHALSFHNRVDGAKTFKNNQDTFTKSFPEYGQLDTFHVSGAMPSMRRSENLSSFISSNRALVTNARCLSEGVDIPKIDCVLFADPKNSVVDIVQAVGRALRLSEGKEYGYVIVPVMLWNEDQVFMEQDDFENIMTILRALGSSDERIVEYFKSVAEGKKSFKDSGPIDFHIPEHITIDADKFISSIEVKCWQRVKKLSKKPFWEARDFTHNLRLKNKEEWTAYCRGELTKHTSKPFDIPANPEIHYQAKGWIDYADWIGSEYYFDFNKAREIARNLDLASKKDWEQYCADGVSGLCIKPEEVPNKPDLIYRWEGWVDWKDWLGIGLSLNAREWWPFEKALEFAKSLDLDSQSSWVSYCQGDLPNKPQKPDHIPENPEEVYLHQGWLSWKDWLKSDRINSIKHRPFNDAWIYIVNLGLKGDQWFDYCEGKLPEKGIKPQDIPSAPQRIYEDAGWISWSHWLFGTDTRPAIKGRIPYREFNQAKMFVHSLKLQSIEDWKKYCRGKLDNKPIKPADIPKTPESSYKNKGWSGYRDWLGESPIKKVQWLPLKDAMDFVHQLKLKNSTEWAKYCKGELIGKGARPNNIPSSPLTVYRDAGLTSLGDWFGPSYAPKNKKPRHLPFEEARKLVHSLNLKSYKDWNLYRKGLLKEKGPLLAGVPYSPSTAYVSKGYINIYDWLGIKYRDFDDARDFVHKLNLKNEREWTAYCKGRNQLLDIKPDDIPDKPDVYYKLKGWVSWENWFKEFKIKEMPSESVDQGTRRLPPRDNSSEEKINDVLERLRKKGKSL